MRQEVEIHCRHLGSLSFPSVEYVDADVEEEADAIHCAHGNVQELYAKGSALVRAIETGQTHFSQRIRERILRSRLVYFLAEQRPGSKQGVNLHSQNDRHSAEEDDHEDRPGIVVRSCSSSKGVGGIGRDNRGDDGEEETDGDEWEDTDAELGSIESC